MKRLLKIPAPLAALIGYTLSVIVIIFSLTYFTVLAAPVFFAFIFAYLLNPFVDYVEKKTRMSRGVIAGLTILTVVVFLLSLVLNLLPYFTHEIHQAATRFPETLKDFSQKMKLVNNFINKNFSEYVGKIDLMDKFEEIFRDRLSHLNEIVEAAFSSLYNLFLFILFMVFVPLIAYYFLKDIKKIQRAFFNLIPTRYKEPVIKHMEGMDKILSSFIRGQAIVVVILATLYSIGLSLINMPFSFLIGIISGIGDFVPYMGTIVGFVLSLIIAFAHFQSIEKLLLVVLVFAAVKGSENWFLYPKIVGKEVGLHFVWVLIAIIFFGSIFGFWGLLVAIPSTAGLKMHLDDLIKYYRNSNFFKKD